MNQVTNQACYSYVPYGDTGSGYYSKKARHTSQAIAAITPVILESLQSIPQNPRLLFTIADYGCADGGTSMPLISACVKKLKELHGENLEINIQYEDQPFNDFKSLFSFVQGLIPGSLSPFKSYSEVYVSACGTEFYQRCFPRHSVNLALCFFAVQWLSEKPCNLSDSFFHLMSKDEKAKEMFSKYAARDWETFLLLRAQELSPGGKLAVILSARDEDGQWLGNTKETKVPIADVMYKVWKTMADEEIITEAEVKQTTFALYIRSNEEIVHPFLSAESPVRRAGFSLLSCDLLSYPRHQGTGDVEMDAKKLIDGMRVWSNHTILSGLSNTRSVEESSMIVDEYYHRLQAEFIKSPDYLRAGVVVAVLLIAKELS
ncbi:uncharacterized protein LOC144653059 [Oculina patagonica]